MSKYIFSSDALPASLTPQQKARAWADTFSASGEWDVSSPCPDGFRVQAELMAFPGVMVSRTDATSIRLVRSKQHIDRDGKSNGFLLINAGRSMLHGRQAGSEHVLHSGDGMFLDLTSPHVSGAEHGGQALAVWIPRETLAGVPGGIDSKAGSLIGHHSEALRLLRGYLTVLLDSTYAAPPQIAAAADRHIGELAALALGDARREPGAREELDGSSGARVALLIQAVRARCSEAGLNAAVVGRPLGLSGRTVQHLLQLAGTTFATELREARLLRAYEMLASPAYRERSVIDIALECGFLDLSTFYRNIATRFERTPGEIRRDAGR